MADAKQGKIPEDFCNGASQSRVVLAKPRLGAFGASVPAGSSSKGCNPFGSVLRPSQLKPGSNPFLKVTEPEEKQCKENDSNPPEEERLKEPIEKPEPPKFVPLGSANAAPRTANPVPAPVQPTAASSPGFIFGQNLSERVVMENMNNGDAAAADHSSSNGTSELLFTTAASTVMENAQEEPSSTEVPGAAGEGLAAAAAAYERSHARPPPPAEHHSLTGEEGETNVLQISCRLFAWEKGSWRERGRGVLRLNDGANGGARLVARVAGSLRVVLNTPLWSDMVVERAGTKSLRITAADAAQQIKLFLIMGAPADIIQLNRALTARIAVTKKSHCAHNVTSQQAAERLEAATDENEFLEKPIETSESKDVEDEISQDIQDEIPQDMEEERPQDMEDERPQDTEDEIPQDMEDERPQDTKDEIPQDIQDESHKQESLESEKTEKDEDDVKALKRKDQTDEDTPPKRPCPEIVID